MDEDELKILAELPTPRPVAEARRRAVGASLMAFDQAADPAREEEFPLPPQGTPSRSRLMSVVATLTGRWTMNSSRLISAGATALAVLILLPLGYALYNSTALTPAGIAVAPVSPADEVALPAAKLAPVLQKPAAPAANAVAAQGAATLPQASAPAAKSETLAGSDATDVAAAASANAPVEPAALEQPAPQPASPPASPAMDQLAAMPADAASPMAESATPPAGLPFAAPVASVLSARAASAVSGDTFQKFTESAQNSVATDPVSTFSIDVDTASYSYVRRALNEGRMPEPDAVRIEEMINYFPYDYPPATSADTPFKPTISVFPTPWNSKTELMAIGIKAYTPLAAARPPANLVFLIDTSGSMDEPDKLPLLQKALGLLVNTLQPTDTVSIVSYAGAAGIVLEPTKASDRAKILSALDGLSAGGATAGAEGIALAYQLAGQHVVKGGNNRVVLATDGDFNVGIADPDALKQFIKQKRQSGVALSVLGFGEGNLDDATMQALAQNGDGNATYIDNLAEAQKVLVKEAGATLDTVAKDVKIQVEFNPATVSAYRLVGYETRALAREDFNNDKVDAGDVGAGHAVTALYEITPMSGDAPPPVDPLRYQPAPTAPANQMAPAGASTELADVKIRYKLPGSETSRLIEQPVTPALVVTDDAKASDDARWAAAVAAFGQRLRGSDYAGSISYGAIADVARGARGADADGYRAEFINLVGLAAGLSGEGTPAGGTPDASAPAATTSPTE